MAHFRDPEIVFAFFRVWFPDFPEVPIIFRYFSAGLHGAQLSSNTILDGVDWGSRILKEEKRGQFLIASHSYRHLKYGMQKMACQISLEDSFMEKCK